MLCCNLLYCTVLCRALVGLPPSNQLYLEAKLPNPALLEVAAAAGAEKQTIATSNGKGKASDSDIECESDTSDNGEPKQD